MHFFACGAHQVTTTTTQSVYLSFTWCLNFSVDPQKVEIHFLVDWRVVMKELNSANQTVTASFSRRVFKCLKSRI